LNTFADKESIKKKKLQMIMEQNRSKNMNDKSLNDGE